MNKVTEYYNGVPRTLGERIKVERTTKQMTIETLAENITSRQRMSKIEKDIVAPDYDELQKIANKLEVTPEYLLGKVECKSLDYIEISRIIGLSDIAIMKLEDFYNNTKCNLDVLYDDEQNYTDFSLIINKFIENENFEPFILYIKKYINQKTIDKLKSEIVELETNTCIDDKYTDELMSKVLGYDVNKINYKESDLFEYKASELAKELIKSVSDELEKTFSKRWVLDKEDMQIKRICNDGSENIKLLKGMGGIANGSQRNNKK